MKMKVGIIILISLILVIVSSCADDSSISSGGEEISMPSLGEALLRYPDNETINNDNSVTEIYKKVSENDFNTFIGYLEQQNAELVDYSILGSVLSTDIQMLSGTISLNYDSRRKEAKITYPNGTFDARIRKAKMHCDNARSFLEDGKGNEALMELLLIPQYEEYGPAVELLQEARLAPYITIGNVISFGRYEQDNNSRNGLEDIEWIIIDYDKKGNKILLLSMYGLDSRQYHKEDKDITWERSTIRGWLNKEFMQTAFTKKEQKAILMTSIDNSKSQDYRKYTTKGGKNTKDKIFLLSYADANKYLGVTEDNDHNNIKARVAPTAYAVARGALVIDRCQTADGKSTANWWLRSPGYTQDSAAIVYGDGSVYTDVVAYDRSVVRPAIWFDLKTITY